MSQIASLVDDVLRRRLAPELKERGYRLQRRDLWREMDDAVLVVNIQGARANCGSSGAFLVNFGKHFPALERLIVGRTVARRLKEYDCHFRIRLENLAPRKLGAYWALDESSDLDSVAENLAAAVREYGLPWLETTTTHLAVAQTCEQSRPLISAAAYYACGTPDDALRVLDTYVAWYPDRIESTAVLRAKCKEAVVA